MGNVWKRSVVGCWLVAMIASGAGCSYGYVEDATTHSLLGGASLSLAHMNTAPDGTPGGASLGAQIGVSTWASGSVLGAYYLNPYPGPANTRPHRQVPEGWLRAVVAKSGYEKRIFYRNHLYAPCSASTKNSVSNTSEAYSPYTAADSTNISGSCAEDNFALYASGTTHCYYPDLIVDPRPLGDYSVSRTALSGNLSFAYGIVNVGDGKLDTAWLGSATIQNVVNASGSLCDQALLGGGAALVFRLRRYDAATCSTERLADQCPVVASVTRATLPCLATKYTFDGSYPTGVAQTADCSPNAMGFVGIGSGRGRYAALSGTNGSAISITGLASGQYWLEAQVNSDQAIKESNYGNNITRVLITL